MPTQSPTHLRKAVPLALQSDGPRPWDALGPTAGPLARLWRLVADERQLVGSVYVYAGLAGAFGLALPLGVQAIIGLVSGGLILQPVVLLIAFVVIGTLATGGLQLLQLSAVERIQQRVFARLALDMTQRIAAVRLDRTAGVDLPELMNRFFEIKTIQKSLGKLLTDWVAAGLQVLFGLALLTLYHPWFLVAGLTLLALLACVFWFTAPRGWATSLGESKYKFRVAHWLEELARSARTFRFAGSASMPLARSDAEIASYLEYRAHHFRVLLWQAGSFVVFKTAITGGLLILGSLLVVNRQITLGQFVASEIVIVLVLLSVEKLILGLADVYDILTALEKASQPCTLPVDEEHAGAVELPMRPEGMRVAVRNVAFTYAPATEPALDVAALDVEPGERLAITGPHGSGESTLLAVIGGLYAYERGAVALDGVSWRDVHAYSTRARIGWCCHGDDLFEGTVEENVSLGRLDITPERVLRVLGEVGLAEWLARQNQGVRTRVEARGRDFSRHVVVRILLARALAAQPRLVLVDSVLDQLDAADRQSLSQLLFDRSQPWSLVVASHEPDVLARADRVVVFDRGRVVHDGSFAATKDTNRYLRDLVAAR